MTSQNNNRQKFDFETTKRVFSLLKGELRLFLPALLCAALSVAGVLIVPLLSGEAIDYIVGQSNVDFGKVRFYAVLIALVALLTALFQWVMSILNNRLAYTLVFNLREEAFRKIQKLPLSYLDHHPVGDTVNRMMNDVDQLTDGLLMGFQQFFSGILTILGTLVLMLSIQPAVSLVVIFLTPLSIFVAGFIAKRTYSLFRIQSEIRSEETALIDEFVGEHKTVAAFGREEFAKKSFGEVNARLKVASTKALFFSSTTNPTTRFVNNLVYAGVALTGALLCIASGDFTVGLLSAFLSYANQYTKPFNELSGIFAELQNALSCAARLFEFLDAPPLSPDVPGAKVLTEVHGQVEFCDVSFSYTPEKELIKDLHLSVRPGERVAIVGPTGCGKTTLINLLMRFYDVDGGSIRVDGTDIRDVTRDSLRANWGMVLQETWLRAGSVRENISFGKPDATEEEVIAAAKAVHADSFIRRLPNGYDTRLSEGGGSLSQGQKQLLCIARVMLSPPAMLILDESTSSIDTRMEKKIQNAFAKLMHGRTSFVVAHRLSTIEDADLILVMKNGSIIERGTHEELLAEKGFYSELYNSQFSS